MTRKVMDIRQSLYKMSEKGQYFRSKILALIITMGSGYMMGIASRKDSGFFSIMKQGYFQQGENKSLSQIIIRAPFFIKPVISGFLF